MISSATIPGRRPAAGAPAFWQAPAVRSFRDIAVTCPCHWEMTFKDRRPSGWALARPLPGCLHHGKQVAR